MKVGELKQELDKYPDTLDVILKDGSIIDSVSRINKSFQLLGEEYKYDALQLNFRKF